MNLLRDGRLILQTLIPIILQLLQQTKGQGHKANWEEWWTYDGISGPAYWGLLNPSWKLCSNGLRQSPINIEASSLLFDPHLRPLQLEKHRVNGIITNTGHGVVFRVDKKSRYPINISNGPLSYSFRFHEIHLHFGLENYRGSEHQIDGYNFPAEIQLYGYNNALYDNVTHSTKNVQGLVVVSVMLQIGELSNPELRLLTTNLDRIRYKGQAYPVRHISIKTLLPETDYFMTYEGSTTSPGCYETVTWIVMNKPIYITRQQLHSLRKLMVGTKIHPKAPLGDNFRPTMPVHHRTIRTNIDFRRNEPDVCPTMKRKTFYKAREWFIDI
ncbi:CA10 (predicted) [Pycnogonum litorale]